MQLNGQTVAKLIGSALRLIRSAGSSAGRAGAPPAGRPRPRASGRARAGNGGRPGSASANTGPGWEAGGYPGDFAGALRPAYSPRPDGEPDPGEVVWAWVPYEEDHTRGKDRPVLLVGRDSGHLLGLMLTSKDRNNANDANADYVDVGTGAWDSQGRPSEVKLDRVVRLDPRGIRREGAVLDRTRFDAVARRLAGRRA